MKTIIIQIIHVANCKLLYLMTILFSIFIFSAFSALQAQSILKTDFNRLKPWHADYNKDEKWADSIVSSSNPLVKASVNWGRFGVIDVQGTSTASEALKFSVDNSTGKTDWQTGFSSGVRSVKNKETNMGKLTVSFDYAVSSPRPLMIQFESYDENRNRTGGLETIVYPATSHHFLRTAFELSAMKPFGEGKFNATSAFVNISYKITGLQSGDADSSKIDLFIDNFCYSTPTYYVSPNGSDAFDGRSEKTAFANPQAAINVAKAGDIILLMEGTYLGINATGEKPLAVVNFLRPGLPGGWISLKNYPNHKPIIHAKGMDGVRIALGDKETYGDHPLLAYIEVRGIHLKGNSLEVPALFPNEIGTSTRNTDNQGININASHAPTRMYHHLRIADCTIEYFGGDGLYVDFTDNLDIENNIFRYNCFTTARFAQAGFSIMHYANFSSKDNVTKILVRNNQAYGNQIKVKRKNKPYIFNGNGMLFDANCEAYLYPDFYVGRTLIQNNLVYGNGGGGIQMWGSHRLDVVNNTVYHNGLTPELKWGNIGMDYCKDVQLINNIIVATDDTPLDRWLVNRSDKDTGNIVRVNNLYFGGAIPNIKGNGDIVADPMFVNPLQGDFKLKSGSPGIQSGSIKNLNIPVVDINAKPVIYKGNINRGAYSFNQ